MMKSGSEYAFAARDITLTTSHGMIFSLMGLARAIARRVGCQCKMPVARTFCLTIMLSTWARYPRAAWMAAPVCGTGGEHAIGVATEEHREEVIE